MNTTQETTTAEVLDVDPATLVIGANVRTDLPDAKQFARSIKQRGVLEVITACRDDEDHLVVLRGQRRAVSDARSSPPKSARPAVRFPSG